MRTRAGTVGILQAATMLAQQRSTHMTHLRSLNVLIENAMQASHGLGTTTLVPRQSLPAAHVVLGMETAIENKRTSPAVSVSSFAFQGTNANVMLATLPGSGMSSTTAGLKYWRRRRFWFTAAGSSLLQCIACSSAAITCACLLDCPALAFMWQHSVNGQATLPATGMIDMLWEVGACILPGSDALSNAAAVCVMGTTLMARCTLQASGTTAIPHAPMVLTCELALAGAKMALRSACEGGMTPRANTTHAMSYLGAFHVSKYPGTFPNCIV